MTTAKAWRFRQIGGDQKLLELLGYAAPFGRPRQQPIVKKKLQLRQSKKRYPGNPRPTRTVWGDMYDDLVLHGRWMDYCIPDDGGFGVQGANAAKTKVREVEDFIRDHERVVIEWGDILSMTGLITALEVAWESEAQCAWEMTIEIDDDALAFNTARLAISYTSDGDFNHALDDLGTFSLPLLFAPSLLDKLIGASNAFIDMVQDNTAIVTGAMGQLQSAAGIIASLAQATDDQVSGMRAAVASAQSSIVTLGGIYETIDRADASSAGGVLPMQDVATLAAPWTFDENMNLRWAQFVLQQQIAMNQTLAVLAEIDAQAELAERGLTTTMVSANMGDTWESLAFSLFGDVDQAATLRDANGAQYGSKPVVGPIIVPRARAKPTSPRA